MTPNNKQRWMGGMVLLSGGALLAALLLQGDGKDALLAQNQASSATSQASNQSTETISEQDFNSLDAGQAEDNPFADESSVTLRPLEMDVETEQALLEEQRAARTKQVAEQEAKTAEFLATQQAAEASAARRAAEEQAEHLARRQARQQALLDSADPPPPEIDDLTADAAAAQAQRRLEENARLDARMKEQIAQAASQQEKAVREAEQAKLRAEEAKQSRATFQAAQEKREQERLIAEKAKRDEEKRLAEQRKKDQALAAQQQKEADEKRLKQEQDAAKKAEIERLKTELDEEKRLAEQHKKDQALAAQQKEVDEKRLKQEQDAAKKAEAERLKAEQQTKTVLDAANKKLEAERARAMLDGDDKPWMVQAGMAATQDAADALAARLKAQGYPVQTSQTSRGVRVLVGPEKGQTAAKALRAKINQDPRINVKGAFELDWQPLAEAAGRQIKSASSNKADKPAASSRILMVQVAMAADQARADAVVAKLKANGYSAQTSQTSRGVRIMVGPASDRDAALALRNKVNQDPKLGMNSAWVINWQPLTP